MRKVPYMKSVALFAVLFLIMPAVTQAQPEQSKLEPPPIEQPLVRQGDLAVKIVFTLALGVTEDEVEAEKKLAEVGIVPRNGWVADYCGDS